MDQFFRRVHQPECQKIGLIQLIDHGTGSLLKQNSFTERWAEITMHIAVRKRGTYLKKKFSELLLTSKSIYVYAKLK